MNHIKASSIVFIFKCAPYLRGEIFSDCSDKKLTKIFEGYYF